MYFNKSISKPTTLFFSLTKPNGLKSYFTPAFKTPASFTSDNLSANATPLKESKFYTGYLQSQKGQGQDTDFYKIDISKNAKLKLAFKHQDLDKKYSWNIELLNQNKETCVNIPMTNGARSINVANSVSVIAYDVVRQNYEEFKNL